jgi:hypothetical protein
VISQPLKKILTEHRHHWDVPATRPAVRQNFTKMLLCRTPALGAEIYASSSERKIVPHTCKSRACPSCGHRATILWQREQWAALPDLPYTGITLTMPDVLWGFFKNNRYLLKDLPAIGATVVQQWAKTEHHAQVLVLVVRHTFGRHLNFNPHLHIMVSSGGFRESKTEWIPELKCDRSVLMQRWRYGVIAYLRAALRAGLLKTEKTVSQVELLLDMKEQDWWDINVSHKLQTREHFLKYAGRYVRRPPIAQYRFTKISANEICFRTNDHRKKREVETRYSPAAFIENLAEHVPEYYANTVRYFGLLSPRSKGRLFAGLFALLGQIPRPRPQRLSWALSIEREFRINPLIDSRGEKMRWHGRLRPVIETADHNRVAYPISPPAQT